MTRVAVKYADADGQLRRLPYVLAVSLMIWTVLLWGFGLMLRGMAEEENSPASITAELMEVHPPEKPVAVPSPPKPKHTPPQLPAPARKPVAQTPEQTPVQTPVAAVALPATNLPSGDKGTPYNAPAVPKLPVSSARGSGDAITPPQFGAAYLNNPKPEYPPFARRMRIQGTVMLKVLVSKDGFSLKVQVAQSSGSDVLDEAAANAVKKWRFVPARIGDKPIEEWVQVPIAFHLN